jgi:hypothetical protein
MTRRSSPSLPGFLVAVLALISQLALGSVVLPDVAPASVLDTLSAAMVDCSPVTPADKRLPPAPRPESEKALCPLSVALALPAVILLPAPMLPPPVLMLSGRGADLPQARAPPSAVRYAPYPTGPPVLA